jgi:hypothetical protein
MIVPIKILPLTIPPNLGGGYEREIKSGGVGGRRGRERESSFVLQWTSETPSFVFMVLEFEHRVSHLLGRHSYHLSHSTSPLFSKTSQKRV